MLVPSNTEPWPEVRDQLNSCAARLVELLLSRDAAGHFRAVDRYIYERVRDFLARRHKVAGRGTRRFSYEAVYATGLIRLEACR